MLNIYICIASGQTLPNLIPAIMLKPDVIWIVSSEAMQEKAEQLDKCISSSLPEVSIRKSDALSDSSFEQMSDYALTLEGEIQEHFSGQEVKLIYNATGGNKLMSIAFSEVFWDHHICYTDTQHDSLLYLRPEYKQLPFANELDIEHYLLANGLNARQSESESTQWQQEVQERKSLSFWLAEHCEQLKEFFPQINRLVSEAVYQDERNKKLSTAASSFSRVPLGLWEQALEKLECHQLIDREDKQTFRFKNLAAAEYIGGKWLEEYAWLVAIKIGCHDVRCGLQVTTQKNRKDNVRNELDCVICHHNRLLVIECKTSRFGNKEQKDSDILFKLDSISKFAGGLFGKRLLLSALPLDHVTASNRTVKNSSRADSMDIATLDGKKVVQLESLLTDWMKTGTF